MADLNKTGYNPAKITRPRSVFKYNKRNITTINVGEIVPIQCEEVLPGDTWHIDNCASVIKAQFPFLSPVYGDLTLSLYSFFVPMRLIWDHWMQFCGQNDDGAWTETNNYLIPKKATNLKISNDGDPTGSIGDYLGLPILTPDEESSDCIASINELPLRAYYRIYNEYFRNENTTPPVLVNYGDEANTSISYLDKPKKAARWHDYFSNALPAPQKGPAVTLPLAEGTLPIVQTEELGAPISSNNNWQLSITSSANIKPTFATNPAYGGTKGEEIKGLGVEISQALATNINQLRLAAQTQVFYETCARYGTRYNELTYGLFAVDTGDTRAYRCEMLGGVHIPLSFQEVTNTTGSGQNNSYALGQQTVKSATADLSSLYIKSAVEHGYIMTVAVIRYQHQYCQGLERKWKRNTFLDFYNPIYDNLGETPVMASEIYAGYENIKNKGSGQVMYEDDPNVFGYQEAWAEYRYWPDTVSGNMRPKSGGLTTMTFADWYKSTPTLNGFMEEQPENVKRTMAGATGYGAFMADFVLNGKVARPMSVRSIPGLTDHHGI